MCHPCTSAATRPARQTGGVFRDSLSPTRKDGSVGREDARATPRVRMLACFKRPKRGTVRRPTTMNANEQNPDDGDVATPVDWALSFARGYLELGMLHLAERELNGLPGEAQDTPPVMSLRSHLLVARRRWRRVVAHARRAVRLFPEAPEYYVHAATAFDMLGQRDESRRIWDLAPDAVRSNGVLHLHVARFEARLGNVDAARDHLASALDLDPRLRSVAIQDPHLTAVLSEHAKN